MLAHSLARCRPGDGPAVLAPSQAADQGTDPQCSLPPSLPRSSWPHEDDCARSAQRDTREPAEETNTNGQVQKNMPFASPPQGPNALELVTRDGLKATAVGEAKYTGAQKCVFHRKELKAGGTLKKTSTWLNDGGTLDKSRTWKKPPLG